MSFTPTRFHGKACIRCGGTERYIKRGRCVACITAQARAWGKANPDKIRASNNQSRKRQRAANPQKHRDEVRAWQATNREYITTKAHEWYIRHKNLVRERDRARAEQRRTPWQRVYSGARKQAVLTGTKSYQGTRCKRCGGTERRTAGCACLQCERLDNAELHAIRAARAAARKQNIHIYEGGPCSKCGGRSRYMRSCACVSCHKQRSSEKRAAKKAYYLAHHALRRARKLRAAPRWLKATGQLSLINRLYAKARRLGLSIDHDIPLAGCRDCGAVGLHVLANLVMIDKAVNLSKNARCTSCFHGFPID